MKILIAYDGSECSEAALDDLVTAGLPDDAEAVLFSVVEAFLPEPPEGVSLHDYAKDLQANPQPFKAWQEHAKEISDAEGFLERAAHRLRSSFPGWQVASDVTYGSAAWEILARAEKMQADLIVVGSHGRSAIGRFFLGSVSQKVLTESHCSVRVARGRVEVEPGPSRIVVGFDASEGAKAAVAAVAARRWPQGTEVRVVAVTDVRYTGQIAMMPPADLGGNDEWMTELAEGSVRRLADAGLQAEFVQEFGNPKIAVAEIAEQWHAGSIFVGANRWGSRVDRFLLGSVSSAIAARAHCSVEVVRVPGV